MQKMVIVRVDLDGLVIIVYKNVLLDLGDLVVHTSANVIIKELVIDSPVVVLVPLASMERLASLNVQLVSMASVARGLVNV